MTTPYNEYPCDQTLCKLPSDPQERVVYEQRDGHMSHSKSRSINLNFCGTTIPIQSRSRNFTISYFESTSRQKPKLVYYPVDMLAFCSDETKSHSGQVSEYYRCQDTELWFVDTRYGNLIAREIVEEIAFTAPAQPVPFHVPYGTEWYFKYVCNDVRVVTTETLYVMVGGQKTILKTVTSETVLYSSSFPLILVYPIVPSQAMVMDEEIMEHGFYDYNAEDSEQMAQEDGGKDFYFPSWCREIGRINQSMDRDEATHRYYTYFLNDEPPPSGTIGRPPIVTRSEPDFSLTVDGEGRTFYSVSWMGETFNFLTDGDPVSLMGLEGSGAKFYPVGLI